MNSGKETYLIKWFQFFISRKKLVATKKENQHLQGSLASLQTRFDQTRAEMGNNSGLERQQREAMEQIEKSLARLTFRKETLQKLVLQNKPHVKHNAKKKH